MHKTIYWIPTDNCPDKQLEPNTPGHPLDAGYDLRIAEDCVIRPYTYYDTEPEWVCPLSEWNPSQNDHACGPTTFENNKGEKWVIRWKYQIPTIPTGVVIAHPEIQAFGPQPLPVLSWVMAAPRSSASKYGIALANTIGVIDIGYTGEVGIRAYSYGPNFQPFKRGEAFCQLIPIGQFEVRWVKRDQDPRTEKRGGWGSTT